MDKLKFRNNLCYQKDGFTLLEMLIALVVFSIGILGVLGMVSISIKGNSLSREMSVATNLAKDKVEEMKNMVLDDLFQPSADPTLSTNAAPVNMTDVDSETAVETVVTPVDNGGNTCTANSPCGDVAAGDLIWTYSLPATVGKTYNRIWTIQRNPTMKVNGANQAVLRSMLATSVVSWTDDSGRAHRVSVATMITE